MRQPRDRPHLVLPPADRVSYRPHPPSFSTEPLPAPPSRLAHGQQLLAMVDDAVSQALQARQEIGYAIEGAHPGIYLQVSSTPDSLLQIHKLETKAVEVVAMSASSVDREGEPSQQKVTLFMPEQAVDSLRKKLHIYANDNPKEYREVRHEAAFDPVHRISLAQLRNLWTDNPRLFPSLNQSAWMEIWLRRSDGLELKRFQEYAQRHEIALGGRRLSFDERIVLLAKASPSQLASSLVLISDLAELRHAPQTAGFFREIDGLEPREWAEDLVHRTKLSPSRETAVCVIDTGVSHRHPLLEHSLILEDCHSCDPQWGVLDTDGHGTEMAGLALYGDLLNVLDSSSEIRLNHRLESVKILPPNGANDPDLYGALCAMATSYVEVQAPERNRVFSMAITSSEATNDGSPTSWSAAIDALAAGRNFDTALDGLTLFEDENSARQRLFILSAGNISDADVKIAGASYLDRCDLEIVEDPAQAWNALTIGAYTQKVHLPHEDWAGYMPLASNGDLSPWSRTGISFDTDWPNKPELVMEGGNAMLNQAGEVDFGCHELSLLTTNNQHQFRLYSPTNATSASCALAARMAASIAAANSSFWPETIRALMVHSARWTEQMLWHLPKKKSKQTKQEFGKLLRRYGYGVPDLRRAFYSAKDALTLVAQDRIIPYAKSSASMTMNHLHLYKLPWPREALMDLGGEEVEVRITLSYFIEPNPGRSGWKDRHLYPSARLRFDLQRATESDSDFNKRINQAALADGEKKSKVDSDGHNWRFGRNLRHRGSLHSDVFTCTGAELSECGTLAVFPVNGWWKYQPSRASRPDATVAYALVVSIETDARGVDLYTPVEQALKIPAAEVMIPI